jgi:hypothetical protein
MEQTLLRNKNATKTPIDWDLNVYCPEQWYGGESTWDADLWKINARIYNESNSIDTDYTLTLLTKEAEQLGLWYFAKLTQATDSVEQWPYLSTLRHLGSKLDSAMSLDGWLDAGLDGFIDLHGFNELYKSRMSDRVLEFLDTLPRYIEDVPKRMMY